MSIKEENLEYDDYVRKAGGMGKYQWFATLMLTFIFGLPSFNYF